MSDEKTELSEREKRMLNRIIVDELKRRCERLMGFYSKIDQSEHKKYDREMSELSREILSINNIVIWLGDNSIGYTLESQSIVDGIRNDSNLRSVIQTWRWIDFNR